MTSPSTKVCSEKGCESPAHGRGLCSAHYAKRWKERNPEKVTEYARKYHQKNKEKRNEHARKYHQKNKEKRNEQCRKYCQENREKRQEYKRMYRKENKEKIAKYNREAHEAKLKNHRKCIQALSDGYIRRLLKDNYNLTRQELDALPSAVIELQREMTRARREIRKSLTSKTK